MFNKNFPLEGGNIGHLEFSLNGEELNAGSGREEDGIGFAVGGNEGESEGGGISGGKRSNIALEVDGSETGLGISGGKNDIGEPIDENGDPGDFDGLNLNGSGEGDLQEDWKIGNEGNGLGGESIGGVGEKVSCERRDDLEGGAKISRHKGGRDGVKIISGNGASGGDGTASRSPLELKGSIEVTD